MKLGPPLCPVCGKQRGCGTNHDACHKVTAEQNAGKQRRKRYKKPTEKDIKYLMRGIDK